MANNLVALTRSMPHSYFPDLLESQPDGLTKPGLRKAHPFAPGADFLANQRVSLVGVSPGGKRLPACSFLALVLHSYSPNTYHFAE